MRLEDGQCVCEWATVCSVVGGLGRMELLHHLFIPGSGTSLTGECIWDGLTFELT